MTGRRGRTVVIDTNVGIVANRKAEVSPECVLQCINTLREVVSDGHLVLDANGLIFKEYLRYLSPAGEPGVGDAFIRWVHDNRYNAERCTLVPLTPTDDGSFHEFPKGAGLESFDNSDRKFVCVSSVHQDDPVIQAALDRGWARHAKALLAAGVVVEHLCELSVVPR